MKHLRLFLRPGAPSLLAALPTGVKRAAATVVALASLAGLSGCANSLNESSTALDHAGATSFSTPASGAQGAPETGFKPTAASTSTATAAQELTKAAKQVSTTSPAGTSAYKVGPQDVLDISVFKVPELSKTVQVADSGTINLPLVGEVPAAGRSAQEIERELAKQLGAKYLQSPQVTVFVKEYNSQRVTIEGAVRKPGVYPIRGRSSLLQAIATAEGLTEVAETQVVVFREANGARTAAKFDIEEIRSGKAQDPQLVQGDTIVVSTSAMATSFQNFLKLVPIGSFVALL